MKNRMKIEEKTKQEEKENFSKEDRRREIGTAMERINGDSK